MCEEPGFLAANDTTNVEVDDDITGSVLTNNEAFQILGQKMEQMAIDYTNLNNVNQCPIDNSYYMPFEVLARYVAMQMTDQL